MNKRFFATGVVVATMTISLLLSGSLFGRTMADLDQAPNKRFNSGLAAFTPAACMAAHRVGKIVLTIQNNGTFGTGFGGVPQDCFTGEGVPSCEYPKGSGVDYLFAGAFWIGGIKGRDTLVSVGADGWSSVQEMFPDEAPFGNMIKRSIIDPTNDELFFDAVSEEDYVGVYTDTITDDVAPDISGRPHIPLNIEVTQRSYAWSYSYAEDFVLFDFEIKNIGFEALEDVYMGIYVDGDVGKDSDNSRHQDDITGFVNTRPFVDRVGCEHTELINTAWLGDNDGDPGEDGSFNASSSDAVTGTRIVRTPAESLVVSYNWWISNGAAALDFGPRHRGTEAKPFRNFTTGGLGTPEGDANKYHVLSNNEFDYDQVRTGIIQITDTLWLFPPQENAIAWSRTLDTRYLLSFGPFRIRPGDRLPLSFAYVAGDNFHTDPDNADDNLFDNYDPVAFYKKINFEDLTTNARWASWIYDNPHVDTDDDGDSGKFWVCPTDVDSAGNVLDSLMTWYQGDGVPDFVGAQPPPAPIVRFEPRTNSITVRFNGTKSETTPDAFSGDVDFEGYRLYLARDERVSSYSVIASFDIEDYNKWVYNPAKPGGAGYELLESPFSIDSLRCLYGNGATPADRCSDTSFDPLDWTQNRPFTHPDFPAESTFFFEAQDFNVADTTGRRTEINKTYPNQPPPSVSNPEEADPSELTDDGLFKFYEYEVDITDLLPTVPYYVSVTAFDFGSPQSGLPSLESSIPISAKETFALPTGDQVVQDKLDVYVYPNPYRADGDYVEGGFEGRFGFEGRLGFSGREVRDKARDRQRIVNFVNLPPRATIRIFTLDGDLVKEIDHHYDDGTAGLSMHQHWDLITRNTQIAVSGIYYWVVENKDTGETQIGKLVLIM